MRSIKHWRTLLTLTASGLFLFNAVGQAATATASTTIGKPVAKPAVSTKPVAKAAAKIPGTPVRQATATAKKPVVKKAVKQSKKRTAQRASDNPDIRSASLIVVDEEDASILLSKNADKPAPIASITKLMTALVILEAQQPLDEKIEITREDRAIDRGGPSRLAAGTVLSRGDLLHLALMSSENRAAYAVGRSYPGGIDALLDAMNAKAKELGMSNARFADPTGLSSKNVASPSDLTKLVIAASHNSTIRSYSTDPEHAVGVGRGKIEYRNTNNLVRNADWDIVVQKTGYTEAAGRCLVMKTVVKDRPVVIVLLNSFGKYTRVADAARIRRWIETGHPQLAMRSAMATQTPASLSR